jgi:Ca2+-binding RTX toxin-like protein
MIDVVSTVTFRTNDAANHAAVDGNSFEETNVLPILYATINTLNIQTLDGNDIIDAVPAGLGGPVINIDGGLPPPVPNPTPSGDVVGDTLNLNMTTATGPVIVTTLPGLATSASTQPLNFTQIEDLNLTDGVLTNAVMGDLYIRGTAAADIIQFTMTKTLVPGVSPATVRTRINTQFFNFNLSNKVVVYGRAGNDTIQMTNLVLPGELYGEANDDYLSGYYGNDLLVGGDGADRLLGSEGANTLWGDNVGEQNLPAGGNDILSSGSGADTAYGGGGIDTMTLGAGADYAFGGYGADNIDGQDGDDRLYGGEGDDTVSGSGGNDLVAGNGGNDRLYGKTGNDVLIGGDGADLLAGDDGNDLLFHNTAVVTSPSAGNDDSTTKNDANDLAMQALLADWTADSLINAVTLAADTDDGDIDTLGGGLGTDGVRKGAGDTGDWEFLF